MTYDPERQRDGSRVFWADYLPDSAACPVLEDGETLRMHDGCRVTRRGDRVKLVEPASTVRLDAQTAGPHFVP